MQNTLGDLNNYLFESLERLMDDSLDPSQLDAEIKRAQAVTQVAEVLVHNGELALKAIKHADEWDRAVPNMLKAAK